MTEGRKLLILTLMFCLAFVGSLDTSPAAAEGVQRMSKEDLKTMMGDSGVVILDVRTGADWENSEQKIKGAVREYPADVESWHGKYPKDKTLVLYCS